MKARITRTGWYGLVDRKDKTKPPCDGCVFDTDKQCWFIEVETIDDIFNLPEHEKVISPADEDDDFDMEIELYDDYRE